MSERFSHDYQLELVAKLIDTDLLVEVGSILQETMFDDRLRPTIKEILRVYVRSGRGPNRKQLGSILKRAGIKLPTKLPKQTNTAVDQDELRNFARYMATRTLLSQCLEHMEHDEYPQVASLLREGAALVTPEANGSKTACSFFDEASRVEARPKIVGTGLPSLDDHLSGGLALGDMGVIIAPSGVGKSRFLVWIGGGVVLEGKKVVHITVEDPLRAVHERYVSRFLGREARMYLTWGRKKLEREIAKCKGKGDLVLLEHPAMTHTVEESCAKIAALGMNPDLVILDYGDDMKPPRRLEQKRIEHTEIFRDIKTMAETLGCPVWTATQSNRPGYRKNLIDMPEVGESLGKVILADQVISLNQDEREGTPGIDGYTEMRIYVAKNRHGKQKGIVKIIAHMGTCHFQEE